MEHLLNATSHVVVLFANKLRRQSAGARSQRIHRRKDTQLGDGTFENDRRIKVSEGGGRGRISEIVGRHIHRLEGGDRTLLGGRDALLKIAHFGGQRRLVTHRRRSATQQRRHLGPCLREAEHVVDEEQHVLVLLVAEILGDRQGRESNSKTGSGRLIHLTIDQTDAGSGLEDRHAVGSDLGVAVCVLLGLDDVGLDHLVVEIVALTGTLTDAREH